MGLNREPIKQWLAKLGRERIDETFDPSLALQRAIDTYRIKGYDEYWIAKRIKTLQERKKLTDIWKENGVTEQKEYREYKGLRKESLRDNMESALGESIITKDNKLNYRYSQNDISKINEKNN